MSLDCLQHPEKTPLTIEALRSIDLDGILRAARPVYGELWSVLSDAARTALENGDPEQGRVLWLLAELCSMTLQPRNANEPFLPFAFDKDRHTLTMQELSDADFDFLAQAVDLLDQGLLKARVADVLWSTKSRRNIRHAHAAIDGYATVSLDEKSWYDGASECITRALELAKSIGNGGGNRLELLTNKIMGAIETAAQVESPVFPILADLAMEFRLTVDDPIPLADRLVQVAQAQEALGAIQMARQCYESARDGYALAQKASQVEKMTAQVAHTWVMEADQCDAKGVHSVIVVNHLQKALQIYRCVSQKARVELSLEDVLPNLRKRIRVEGARAAEQIPSIRIPGVPIGDLIGHVKALVRQKPLVDAMEVFTNLAPFVSRAKTRDEAVKSLQSSFFARLMEGVHFHQSGRVVAKREAMTLGADPREGHEEILLSKMVTQHGLEMNLMVRGCILPALAVVREEHCINETDMVDLARNSTLVPQGRALMVGRGLYWGFTGDFCTAAHFLIPQFENIIRYQMLEAGLNTSTTKVDGVENENGLSTLLEVPGVDDVLGEDAAFEIRALFCRADGPNLRNAFAHGLLDDSEFYSAQIVYAWWFILKYISRPYWTGMEAARAAAQAAEEQSDQASPGD